MKLVTQFFKTFQFTITAVYSFLLSLIFGSLIFLIFILTQSLTSLVIGFWYVIISLIINLLLLIDELLQAFNNKKERKIHINSVILLSMNIPIATLYYFILVFFNF